MTRELTIGGEAFACIDDMPVGLLFDLASASGDGAIRTFRRVLDTVVLEDDHERLNALLYRTTDPITLDALSQAVGTLMTEYAGGRPTERSSSLPAGSAESGQPSRVVSLGRATTSPNGHSEES